MQALFSNFFIFFYFFFETENIIAVSLFFSYLKTISQQYFRKIY